MIHRPRSLALAASALALCLAGSSFAQDRGYDGRPDRNERYSQSDPRGDRYAPPDRRGDPRGDAYRDRRDFREHQDFREGRQADRRGYPQPHDQWRRGDRVPPEYRSRNYVVDDWRLRRLRPPPRGYQWIGVGGDYVLAAVATGVIAQIVVGQ